MQVPTKSPRMAWISAPLAEVQADLVVLPWFEGDHVDEVPGLDQATGGEFSRALSTEEFVAKPFDLCVAPVAPSGSWRARRIALIGAGPRPALTPAVVRRLATAAGLAARQRRAPSVAFAC